MKTLYHGSAKLFKTLKPNFDKRLGIFGLFVSDEIYGPMAFSLLPDRSLADVSWQTNKSENHMTYSNFISGEITTLDINESGYVYQISDYNVNDIKTLNNGDLYFTKEIIPNKILKSRKSQLINFGFKINIIT